MPTTSNVTSYFMDKIFPILIGSALTASLLAVGMYFRLNTVASAVEELRRDTVRKDVLTETLEPMKKDICEMKNDIKTVLREINN